MAQTPKKTWVSALPPEMSGSENMNNVHDLAAIFERACLDFYGVEDYTQIKEQQAKQVVGAFSLCLFQGGYAMGLSADTFASLIGSLLSETITPVTNDDENWH